MDKTSGGSVTHTRVYYPTGGAMRINSTLYYVSKDHLDSASVVTDASGNIVGEQRYYPFGETRFTTGTIYTDKLFTGQREMAGLGIYHYGARFYSPKLGRFLSPDTIVPGYANPQAFNRYSYVLNNPIKLTDPSGHKCVGEAGECLNNDGSTGGGFTGGNNGGGNNSGCGGKGQKSCGGGGGGDCKNCSDNKPDNKPGGGGGKPLPMPDPNLPDLTTPSTTPTGTLPPFTQSTSTACELTDCILSGVSILASGFAFAFMAVPEIVAAAFIVDLVVTIPAVIRTNNDYRQGEISQERQWILNGTGLIGLIPGPWGFGLSVVNGMATFSGYPP